MAKDDLVRRIDQNQDGASQRTGGGAGVTIVTGSGDANTLNGYRASPLGGNNMIPVLDQYGHLLPTMLPDSAAVNTSPVTGGTEVGARYIGPTAWLVSALDERGAYLDVNGWIGNGDEWAIIQHYTVPNENIRFAGAPTTIAANRFRYPIYREQRGTPAQAFPVGAKVVALGKANRGGYLVENSGSGLYAPYVDAWQNAVDDAGLDATNIKNRFGNLAGIGASTNPVVVAFRDSFPNDPNYPIDWDSFGLATDNGYFRGKLIATGGYIQGNFDVTGVFRVGDPDSPASMEVGQTVAGWGMAMRNQHGRPFWSLVSAYEAATGLDPETVWSVVAEGQQVIRLNRQEGTDDVWELQVGPFMYRPGGMVSIAVDSFGDPLSMIAPGINYYKFAGLDISETMVQVSNEFRHLGDTAGFYAANPVAQQYISAVANDLTSVIALANNLRTILLNLGLARL